MMAGRSMMPTQRTMPALPHSRTIPAPLSAQMPVNMNASRRSAPQPIQALAGAGLTAAELAAKRGSLQKVNAGAATAAAPVPAVADTESKMVEGPIILNGQVHYS